MHPMLNTAVKAARQAGSIILRAAEDIDQLTVKNKSANDFVSEVDVASEEAIINILKTAYPTHGFLGEESGFSDKDADYIWIIDPLDGTTNFVHQLRSFSVSIALLENRQPVVGVVHDPLLDECFYATRTGGAFLNGEPIQTSGCEKLHNAMVVTGFSPSVTKESIEARRFLEMLGKAQTIRRLGSAALNLCFLACGRVDAYWASSLNAWDIAAGTLILSEAGGFLRPIEGEFDLFRPQFIAASTDALASEISETINFSN